METNYKIQPRSLREEDELRLLGLQEYEIEYIMHNVRHRPRQKKWN